MSISESDRDELSNRLNAETAKIPWSELQRFFAKGVVLVVDAQLDIIEVACELSLDNKSQWDEWLSSGQIAKVSDKQAQYWFDSDALLWAVVVAPWVLVQEK